jgi:glycosyltransferase involved in cell wall biosynthesis
MRTVILWHCVFPWDIRIEKLLKLLSGKGHEVHLICRGREGLPKDEGTEFGQIHRVGMALSGRTPLSKYYSYPLFFNPIWLYAVAKNIIKNKIQLIIVRDLPLALLAGIMGKVFKIPVVFDMAENYPAALIAYSKARYKPFLIMNGFIPRFYEGWSLNLVDHIFVVAEEQKARLVKGGVSGDRITCVRNTPDLKFFSERTGAGGEGGGKGDEVVSLLYVGKIDRHRGVHLLIEAMPEILRHFPNARLRIVGNGTEREKLLGMVEALGLNEVVDLKGWVEFDRVPRMIKESTICLIPHLRSEHTDTTLPNKIFDYMALGKPVIASNCRPLERIIREEECGLVFNSGDSVDLSAKVIQLLSDRHQKVYGSKGRRAVEQKYNWAMDSQRIMDFIEGIPGSAKDRKDYPLRGGGDL